MAEYVEVQSDEDQNKVSEALSKACETFDDFSQFAKLSKVLKEKAPNLATELEKIRLSMC